MPETTGELVKARAILEADVEAAIQAYMSHPDIGEFALGEGYVMDLTEAVGRNTYSKSVLADHTSGDAKRRTAVQVAILLAVPQAKG